MILATVRHSGSHWAFGMLEQHFKRYNSLYEVGREPHFFFTHTESDKMGRIRALINDGHKVIRTIRHPASVAKSWQKRGMVLDQTFIDQWHNLFSLPGDMWLSVDSPYRDDMLTYVSAKLGVTLETDWQPKNAFTENRFKGEGPNWHEISDQITGFERFYPLGEGSVDRGRTRPAANG